MLYGGPTDVKTKPLLLSGNYLEFEDHLDPKGVPILRALTIQIGRSSRKSSTKTCREPYKRGLLWSSLRHLSTLLKAHYEPQYPHLPKVLPCNSTSTLHKQVISDPTTNVPRQHNSARTVDTSTNHKKV